MTTYKEQNRGFTLLELLVVIIVIGLLSAIVLAFLNTARDRGGDAAVKVNLDGAKKQIELYYNATNFSYGTAFPKNVCPAFSGGATNPFAADAKINAAIAEAAAKGGGGIPTSCASVGSPSATAYAIAVALKTAGQSRCVDSTGQSKTYTTPPGTPVAAIDLATAKCN